MVCGLDKGTLADLQSVPAIARRLRAATFVQRRWYCNVYVGINKTLPGTDKSSRLGQSYVATIIVIAEYHVSSSACDEHRFARLQLHEEVSALNSDLALLAIESLHTDSPQAAL